MKTYRTQINIVMLVIFCLQTVLATPLQADHILSRFGRLVKESHYCGTPPAMCEDGAIEQLAENIDWLEHHIDCYGSIVAKQPDVWGEARLTKHRDEFERIMYQELNQFEFKLNAAISQSDQSFAEAAFSLNQAAGGGDGENGGNGGSGNNSSMNTGASGGQGGAVQLDLNVSNPEILTLDNSSRSESSSETMNGSGSSGGGGAGGSSGSSVPQTQSLTSLTPGGIKLDNFAQNKINVEPTVYLDQLSRYVQHLHELRRINEGDDTSDAPGYALNLVRMPVSVLPGKITREGWGAEITVTAEPKLSDDLLPTTFRNLVINDMIEQNALPIAQQLLNDKDRAEKLMKIYVQHGNQVFKWLDALDRWLDLLEQSSISHARGDENLARAINFFQRRREYLHRRFYGIAAKAAEQAKDFNENCIEEEDFIVSVTDELPGNMVLHWGITWKDFAAWLDEIATVTDPTNVEQAQNIRIYFKISPKVGEPCDAEADSDEKSTEPENNELSERTGETISPVPASANPYKEFTLLEDAVQLHLMSADNISKRDISKAGSVLPLKVQLSGTQPEQSTNNEGVEELPPPEQESKAPSRRQITSRFNRIKMLIATYADLEKLRSAAIDLVIQAIRVYFEDSYNNLPSIKLDDSYDFPEVASAVTLPSRSTDITRPLSPSQYIPAYGFDGYMQIAYHAYTVLSEQRQHKEPISILDIRAYLSEEIKTAYNWLEAPGHLQLWLTYCSRDLATAIHRRDYQTINKLHRMFERDARVSTERSVTGALAWAIFVHSALLNDRLNKDVRKIGTAKDCCSLRGAGCQHFFIPDSANCPSESLPTSFQVTCQKCQAKLAEASAVFQEYVKCRWPVHVFALDPRETDQNIADLSARRRELQLALSMAFVQGEINANTLMRYSRQLETEIETITLNRTISGYGHGNDTFGWRFFPRVQALDQPGSIGTVWQSFRGTPRDADVRHRQIETGMRECVAIVLLPSFVPYCEFDVRSNWFRLTNPRNAALTMKDTVKLSRAITTMRRSRAQCSQCQHLYRDREVHRLMKRIDQLDRELPLQSLVSQIPFENTLAGHEMFNTGVSSLAPKLIGWYGAPGIVLADDPSKTYGCGCYADCDYCKTDDANCKRQPANIANVFQSSNLQQKTLPFPICEGEGTTLFLVGKNLSVHDTKLIAGGVCIPHVRLISRDLMRVTIPSCVNTVTLCKDGEDKEYVAIYAATPYGTTHRPVYVPVLNRDLDKETKDEIKEAVEEEVKKQVAELKLSPRDLGVSFATDSKMEIVATCDESNPTAITFSRKAGTRIPAATYQLYNQNLKDEPATFYVSVYYKGKFHGPMIKVPKIPNILTTPSAPTIARLAEQGTITSSMLEQKESEILDQIKTAIGVSALSDGKESAKLVFFVNVACSRCKVASMRLTEELDIEVTAPCKCCNECDDCSTASTTSESQGAGNVALVTAIVPTPSQTPTPAHGFARREASANAAGGRPTLRVLR